MKKLQYLLAFILTFSILTQAIPAIASGDPQLTSLGDWYMAKQGYWVGRIDGKAYWYRISPEGEVSRTTNGRSWESADPVVGKDSMGTIIRLTESDVLTGEDQQNAWIPVVCREWDQEEGLDYDVDYNSLIWSTELPQLYRRY